MAKTIEQMTAEIREVNVAKGWRPAGGPPKFCPKCGEPGPKMVSGQSFCNRCEWQEFLPGGPGENTWGDYVALLHSEISEALEAYRDHRLADATKAPDINPVTDQPRIHKPEGVGSELADVLIRLLDMCDVFGVPVSDCEYLRDVRGVKPPIELKTFGDHMAWLHDTISGAWVAPKPALLVLRALVATTWRYGIDLDAEYERKIAYNRTRPFQHGGRTLAGGVPPRPAEVTSPHCPVVNDLCPGDDRGALCSKPCHPEVAEHPSLPVLDPRLISGGGKTTRQAKIREAMPTDPRGWWTGEEADEFIDEWRRLELPDLVMSDGQGEVFMFWCVDVRYAAALIDMADHVTNDEGFDIKRGEYVASIVQAEKKETSNGNS